LRIRPARPRDQEKIDALLTSVALPTLDRQPHLADFVVAFDEAELVGVAGIEVFGRAGVVRHIAVATRSRERGLGRELFRSLLTRVNELGLTDLYLRAKGAGAFLEKLGFESVARRDVPFEIRESRALREPGPEKAPLMRFSLDSG